MHPVQTYLDRLHEIHATRRGTPELSYRGALENLLNAIGGELDPSVQATGELADEGSGRPDFGIFERKSGNARCAVEVKPPEDDVPETADGTQVARYWKRYGYVLVTNYRDFLLVVKENGSRARVEARYTLAADAETLWRLSPRATAKAQAEPLTDFLVGVLTRSAPITRPRDLAADLARHAREAKRRLERHDIAALAPLQQAMEEALGLHFEGPDGAAFFRSSLVQTLFYGLFSGWMLWREPGRRGSRRAGSFSWKEASEHLALPLIGDLYDEIAKPRRLADLGLREPLEWATTSLNRVEEAEFFQNFDADHAITLFYEPFLQAFDPDLRKQLGVWYTPPEIVQYMVGRVDQLLRSELNIAGGLADEQVYVLDPACGTGSYLVEVARRIHQTLTDQGHGALAAAGVKKALTTRIFGFEILPAPYIVAHLQLGVLLRSWATTFDARERAGVFLTNSLTGWEPPKGPKQTLAFKFLEDERDQAAKIKQATPILVILGNPPYNAFAGVAQDEEADLIRPYKEGLRRDWGVTRQSLDDLYVRFFRVAERRIGECASRGIVSYISNYSWLDGLSHPLMRLRLLRGFDQIWIDNCNGDKYKTGKRTPEGGPDESMFTTDEQSIGIQVGTAITTFVKSGQHADKRKTRSMGRSLSRVFYRDLWGPANDKRAELQNTLRRRDSRRVYTPVAPAEARRFAFTPGETADRYARWPSLAELTERQFVGIETCRDEFLIDIDRTALDRRMRTYFDPDVTDAEMKEVCPTAMTKAARFDPHEMRRKLLRRGYNSKRICNVSYRPFDDRFVYWELEVKLLNERRAEFAKHAFSGNLFLIVNNEREKLATFDRVFVSEFPCEKHLLRPDASAVPFAIRHDELNGGVTEPNFKAKSLEAICRAYGAPAFESGGHTFSPEAIRYARDLFFHLIAVLHSDEYRTDNAAALRQGWTRVPIPADPQALDESAKLGRTIADLLLPSQLVPGVTTGRLRRELRELGIPSKIGAGNINPAVDLRVDAGWGFRGQKNAVMCGKGKADPHVVVPPLRGRRIEPDALDIYINDRVYWSNVPSDVWKMTIGGYPVIKKWLSYREHKVLGRPLKLGEMTYITEVVRRLKALLLLGPDLDANYRACAERTIEIPRTEATPH